HAGRRDVRALAGARPGARRRPRDRVRRPDAAAAADGVRRRDRLAGRPREFDRHRAALRPRRPRAARRRVAADGARRLVRRRLEAVGVSMAGPALADWITRTAGCWPAVPAHRPVPRHVLDTVAWGDLIRTLGETDWELFGLWGDDDAIH